MTETKRYFIKAGYHCSVKHGQTLMFEGQQDSIQASAVWQYRVYEYASRLIRTHQLRSVLDIGCGCAVKLKNQILPLCQDITGIDEPDTISWCKQHYDFGAWYADNLENPRVDLGRTFDIIIAADVIEHLVNPDKMLELIKKFSSRDSFIIVSTPERDVVRGKDDMGPPLNPLHAQEWNFSEFRQYIEHRGFRVIEHLRVEGLTPSAFQQASIPRRLFRITRMIAGELLQRKIPTLFRRRSRLLECQVVLLKYAPVEEKRRGRADNPLFSIITPVLNMNKYLEECIQSVLHQTYPHIEHLFIDGGSTDGTLEILASYQAKYPDRIRFISELDKSAGEAWNKGLKMARGQIFGWLGADDTYESYALATVVEFFKVNPDTYFLFGDCDITNEKGKVIGKCQTKEFDFNEAINDKHYIPCPSAFYKREVVERVGLMDTRETGCELDYWIRVGKVFPIHRIEKVLSSFREHPDSVSGAKDASKMYIRDGFTVSRRHGGSLFSPRARRYYSMVIVEGLRPILGRFYPFINKVLGRESLSN